MMEGIEKELARLGRAHWKAVIDLLQQHYEGFPLDNEDEMPAVAIYPILQGLDPEDYPDVLFVNRVGRLDCFSYRAYFMAGEHAVYWNPLEERYEDFLRRAQGQTTQYQVDVENPPTDIIRKWLNESIRQP